MLINASMKILILNWRDTKHPKSGGAEQVTMRHARGWVEMGHQVVWYTSGYLNVPRDELMDGVQIIRRGGSLTFFFVAPFYLLYLVFRGVRFDVVIDEFHGFPFFSILYLPFPVVAFIHEVAGEIWNYMAPFPINRIGKFLEPFIFSLYNFRKIPFWVDAPSTIKELQTFGIPKERCLAIPCPISVPEKVPHPPKEKAFTCIFVSRVVKMKGIEEVIQSFVFITKKYPQATLWIVGSGDAAYVFELKQLIDHLGIGSRILFTGQVSEIKKYELLAKAQLLLLASVKEGWGLVVLEAAYQGTPSVVYNVPGLCDTVKNDKTGVVLSQNSPEAMANAAIDLFENKRKYEQFQKNGQEWVKSLNWHDAVIQSEALLKRAIHE